MEKQSLNLSEFSSEKESDCDVVINELMADLNLIGEVKITIAHYPFIVKFYQHYTDLAKDSLVEIQKENCPMRDIKRCQILESLSSMIKDFEEDNTDHNPDSFFIYKKPFLEDIEELRSFSINFLKHH